GGPTCRGVSQFPRSVIEPTLAVLPAMKIKLTSIMVDDQDKALRFYTEVLGFQKKHDMPAGGFRWITVVSPEGPSDLELVLEPNVNPAAKAFQKAMFEQGIPLTSFESSNIDAETKRLKEA